MVRDSRTPGTYTVSVFTKGSVRYGANSAKWGEMVAPWIMGSSRIAQLTRHLPPADGL